MKPFFALAAALSVMSGAAFAAGLAPLSGDYEASAKAYVESRMADPHMATIKFDGAPYEATVSLRGHQNMPCWALDMRVKASTHSGGFDRYAPVTVLFRDGAPFALKADVQGFARADNDERLAQN